MKGHIVEIRGGVDDEQQNVKIGLEFWEAEFAIYLG